MPYFNVYQPNGHKHRLVYSKDDDKNEVLNKTVLAMWEEYCSEHWMWLKKYDPFKMNFEDKTKSFLERCGTFLLLGNFGYGNIVRDLTSIYEVETSICEDKQEATIDCAVNFDMLPSNKSALGHTLPHHNARKKVKKRYCESQSYKVEKLFKFDGFSTYHWYKLKNKDVLGAKCPEDQKYADWKNKTYNNVHGEPVFEYRPCQIKSRTGILDPNKPYVSEWCYVWADNTFNYGGHIYTIDAQVSQYGSTLEKFEEIFKMDKILVYEQENKMYFFDQSVNQINNEMIRRLRK